MPKKDKLKRPRRVSLSPEVWGAVITHLDFHDLCGVRILGKGWAELVRIEVKERVLGLMERFFPGAGEKVLDEMNSLGLIVSGSSIVRVIADTSSPIHNEPVTDLDIYVPGVNRVPAQAMLQDQGYRVSEGDAINLMMADMRVDEMHHYGQRGIASVAKFTHPETGRRLDFVVCASSGVIRGFHSTVVQNWVKQGKLVCRYPKALNTVGTFLTGQNPYEYHEDSEEKLRALKEKWARYGFPFMTGAPGPAQPQQLTFAERKDKPARMVNIARAQAELRDRELRDRELRDRELRDRERFQKLFGRSL